MIELELLQIHPLQACEGELVDGLTAGKPALLNIMIRSQISPRAQAVVDSRRAGGAF